MTNNTTSTGRLVMSIISFVTGILLLTLVPILGSQAFVRVLNASLANVAKTGEAAPKVVSFFFPTWLGLCVVAGAILLLLARPICQGETWARPLALGLLAIPSITGAYIFGPIAFFAKPAITSAVFIMFCGLVPYFIILLYERSSAKEKFVNAVVFLLLGILAAASFTNGHSSLRMLYDRPDPYLYNTEYLAYAIGIPAIWTGVVLVVAGIPLLAARRKSGWLFSLMGTSAILFSTAIFLFGSPNFFFVAGLALSIITLGLLLTPRLTKYLIDAKPLAAGESSNSIPA